MMCFSDVANAIIKGIICSQWGCASFTVSHTDTPEKSQMAVLQGMQICLYE